MTEARKIVCDSLSKIFGLIVACADAETDTSVESHVGGADLV